MLVVESNCRQMHWFEPAPQTLAILRKEKKIGLQLTPKSKCGMKKSVILLLVSSQLCKALQETQPFASNQEQKRELFLREVSGV